MFGKFLSSTIKVVTLPLDAANIAMDFATGGSGSKASRTNANNASPLSWAEQVRDEIADAAKDIDK